MSHRVSVVIATRNRVRELRRTLSELAVLPDRPELVVVDNASTDGTAAMVRQDFPTARLVRLRRNIGAAGRNVGVRLADGECVAFSDDDSWWLPGALDRVADLFDQHQRLGAVAARTLVGPDSVEDPLSRELAASPLPRLPDLPGPSVLGFMACSTAVRRTAFLDAGGFDPLLFIMGEESLLAYDLTAAGWGVCYVDEVVARHFPSRSRDPQARESLRRSNDLLTCWMRRPWSTALHRTWSLARSARGDRTSRRALARVARALPRALVRRRALPTEVEAQIRLLENQGS
ncbi:MAG TPA: glycosyltransferase [Mycobacteriales bacterium]